MGRERTLQEERDEESDVRKSFNFNTYHLHIAFK